MAFVGGVGSAGSHSLLVTVILLAAALAFLVAALAVSQGVCTVASGARGAGGIGIGGQILVCTIRYIRHFSRNCHSDLHFGGLGPGRRPDQYFQRQPHIAQPLHGHPRTAPP